MKAKTVTTQQLTHLHVRVRQLSLCWLLLALAAGIYYLLPDTSRTSVAAPSALAEKDTSLQPVSLMRSEPRDYTTRNIAEIQVGDRVLAHNPEVSAAERASWREPDWSQCRRILLEMDQGEQGTLRVDLIRPLEWIRERGARLGEVISVDLPEMGAEGPARVVALLHCPPINSGPGQVVTATFAHPPSTDVLNVRFEDDSTPIGVTDNHPFWSVDQQAFVPIGDMAVGEQVRTFHGDTKRIEAKLPRPLPRTVYNLEVYADHVYFVGHQGILAHNTYNLWRRGWFIQQAKKGTERAFEKIPGRTRAESNWLGFMSFDDASFWSKTAGSSGQRIVVTGSVAETPWGIMNRYNPAKWEKLPDFRRGKFYSNFAERGLGDVDLWEDMVKTGRTKLTPDDIKKVEQQIFDRFGEFPDYYKIKHYEKLIGGENSFTGLGVPALVFEPDGRIWRIPAKWERAGF